MLDGKYNHKNLSFYRRNYRIYVNEAGTSVKNVGSMFWSKITFLLVLRLQDTVENFDFINKKTVYINNKSLIKTYKK